MEQFFVMRRYRRCGVGEAAARWLFARYPGRWQVRERHNNLPAQAFWHAIIGRYTSGRYDELSIERSPTGGPVQFFVSGVSPSPLVGEGAGG
jgi:predicted acetyltransferase